MKKALVIEFSTAHYELFYSEKIVLERSFDVYFAYNPQRVAAGISPRVRLSNNRVSNFLKLTFFLIFNRIDFVLLNSASGSQNLIIALILKCLNIKCSGILHDLEKPINSKTQKKITKFVSNYIALSKQGYNFYEHKIKGLFFFYPCYFPHPKSIPNLKKIEKSKKNDQMQIVIIGQIEEKRRSYSHLLNELSQTSEENRGKWCFHILGNNKTIEAQKLIKEISEHNLESYFEFHHLPEDQEVYEVLSNCDLVLPLIHSNIDYFENYKRSKISGSFNLAIGFCRPILFSNKLQDVSEFAEIGFFYQENSLLDFLNVLTKEQLVQKSEEILTNKQFKIQEQFNNAFN
jgi:hypothetical protein